MHIGMSTIFQNPGQHTTDLAVYKNDVRLAEMAEPLGRALRRVAAIPLRGEGLGEAGLDDDAVSGRRAVGVGPGGASTRRRGIRALAARVARGRRPRRRAGRCSRAGGRPAGQQKIISKILLSPMIRQVLWR